MREEVIIAKGRPLRIKNLASKNRWIQLSLKDGDDRILDGKYHPKLTFFYKGNQNGKHSYSLLSDYAVLVNMYGHQDAIKSDAICRQFPDDEQLLLMEEYGETLLEQIKEQELENIIQELKVKCKV